MPLSLLNRPGLAIGFASLLLSQTGPNVAHDTARADEQPVAEKANLKSRPGNQHQDAQPQITPAGFDRARAARPATRMTPVLTSLEQRMMAAQRAAFLEDNAILASRTPVPATTPGRNSLKNAVSRSITSCRGQEMSTSR